MLDLALLVVQKSNAHIDDVLLFVKEKYANANPLPTPRQVIKDMKGTTKTRTASANQESESSMEIEPPQTREQIFKRYAKSIAAALKIPLETVLKNLQDLYGNSGLIPSLEMCTQDVSKALEKKIPAPAMEM
jgi:sulfur relay (sulfurtransferase) DsrC/TusE family protein